MTPAHGADFGVDDPCTRRECFVEWGPQGLCGHKLPVAPTRPFTLPVPMLATEDAAQQVQEGPHHRHARQGTQSQHQCRPCPCRPRRPRSVQLCATTQSA
eukprot:366324-Chlamydomonas_euryale.AAC.4